MLDLIVNLVFYLAFAPDFPFLSVSECIEQGFVELRTPWFLHSEMSTTGAFHLSRTCTQLLISSIPLQKGFSLIEQLVSPVPQLPLSNTLGGQETLRCQCN